MVGGLVRTRDTRIIIILFEVLRYKQAIAATDFARIELYELFVSFVECVHGLL